MDMFSIIEKLRTIGHTVEYRDHGFITMVDGVTIQIGIYKVHSPRDNNYGKYQLRMTSYGTRSVTITLGKDPNAAKFESVKKFIDRVFANRADKLAARQELERSRAQARARAVETADLVDRLRAAGAVNAAPVGTGVSFTLSREQAERVLAALQG